MVRMTLKATEFDRACKETGSEWRQGRVIRIWKSWSYAQGALKGSYVPKSGAERATRSAAGRFRGTKRGDPIRGVRLWLETKPTSETLESYKAFRQAYNDQLPEGEPPLYSKGTLVKSQGLRWGTIKDVARGKLTLTEALAARSSPTVKTAAPAGELVGGKAAAEALGQEYETLRWTVLKRDFPPIAARIGTWRMWRKEDIVRYRDGRRDYITRQEGELEGEVLGASDVSRGLGISRTQLEKRVNKQRWNEVPKPAGKLGTKVNWWLRSPIEKWERERTSGAGNNE